MPKRGGAPGRYVEVEGPPDLIVEIVRDASEAKDTERLPRAYFQAGVQEYWLADARGDLKFQIYRRGQTAFGPVPHDQEGNQQSTVFATAYRLDGQRDEKEHWRFDLVESR